jgi:hypothetical protein
LFTICHAGFLLAGVSAKRKASSLALKFALLLVGSRASH